MGGDKGEKMKNISKTKFQHKGINSDQEENLRQSSRETNKLCSHLCGCFGNYSRRQNRAADACGQDKKG